MQDIRPTAEKWSPEMDNLLRSLVKIHGTQCWTKIASVINTQMPSAFLTFGECESRWQYLRYHDSKEAWTDKEELEMFIAHEKYQNKWSNIAWVLGKRSNNTIKNRFYSIFRKVKNKVLKHDLRYDSDLETVEAFYIMNLMEQHFARPPSTREGTGKRGKDFIYSLLKGLDIKKVTNYRTELKKLGTKEISLEEFMHDTMKHNSSVKWNESTEKPNSRVIGISSYITENQTHEKFHYVLPLPKNFNASKSLTDEEKAYIHSQLFQSKKTIKSTPIYTSSSVFPIQSAVFYQQD